MSFVSYPYLILLIGDQTLEVTVPCENFRNLNWALLLPRRMVRRPNIALRICSQARAMNCLRFYIFNLSMNYNHFLAVSG